MNKILELEVIQLLCKINDIQLGSKPNCYTKQRKNIAKTLRKHFQIPFFFSVVAGRVVLLVWFILALF